LDSGPNDPLVGVEDELAAAFAIMSSGAIQRVTVSGRHYKANRRAVAIAACRANAHAAMARPRTPESVFDFPAESVFDRERNRCPSSPEYARR
jgi:hypothetical protein